MQRASRRLDRNSQADLRPSDHRHPDQDSDRWSSLCTPGLRHDTPVRCCPYHQPRSHRVLPTGFLWRILLHEHTDLERRFRGSRLGCHSIGPGNRGRSYRHWAPGLPVPHQPYQATSPGRSADDHRAGHGFPGADEYVVRRALAQTARSIHRRQHGHTGATCSLRAPADSWCGGGRCDWSVAHPEQN